MQSDRKTELTALPNEESSNVVVCVSGITRKSNHSHRLQVNG